MQTDSTIANSAYRDAEKKEKIKHKIVKNKNIFVCVINQFMR